MSDRHRLEQLLQNPQIWKAGRGGPDRPFLPTGHARLDNALAGGWPLGQLIELLVEPYGIGELQLLMPVLSALTDSESTGASRWSMLVAPPYIPYAPALSDRGLDLARLLVVRCRRDVDVLWAVEQAAHSNTCAAVLAWSDGADEHALRRLQLAVEASGSCLLVLFRPLRFQQRRSPAALRIRLQPGARGATDLHVFKNRGGRPLTVSVHPGDAE